jgi:hypothetical protein
MRTPVKPSDWKPGEWPEECSIGAGREAPDTPRRRQNACKSTSRRPSRFRQEFASVGGLVRLTSTGGTRCINLGQGIECELSKFLFQPLGWEPLACYNG